MPKFQCSKISKLMDDEGNVIVSLTVTNYDRYIADMAVRESKDCNSLSVEIKKYRANRSLEQNKMFWALATKIALETAGSKTQEVVEDVYCNLLEEANVESDFMLAPSETEATLKKSFRVVRKRGTREVNGKTLTIFQFWLGSSKFDTEQMTELIELALNRCADLGIADSETELIRSEYKK